MSEQKFDPMTGQPINPANPSGFKFDPMTGKPINQTTTEGTIKFDPMTGKPVNQQAGSQPTFGAQNPEVSQPAFGAQNTAGTQNAFGAQSITGSQPAFGGQTYGSQTFGGQQGSYGYDPVAIEKANSDKNKKVAFIVLGFLGVAVVGLLIFGGVKLSKFVSDRKNQKVVENVEPEVLAPDVLPEEPEPVEPEQPEEPEMVQEMPEEGPAEGPAEEPVEQQPAETPAEEPEDGAEEGPAEEAAKQTVASSRPGVDMSNLFAFQVGEYTYQLPEKVSDFLDDGWTFNSEKEASQLIGADAKEYMALYYPGTDNNISVWIKNYSLDAEEAKNCYVVEMDFNDNDAQEIGTISVMNGKAVIAQTREKDIVDICGEPSRVSESSLGNSYYYYDPSTSENDIGRPYVCLSMSDDGIFDIVTISNDSEPTDFEQVEVSSDVPDYIYNYEAPKSLGSDPFSGNFELDGVVYNLPVPLQVLEANGWKTDADSNHAVGAGEGYVITIEKGDRRVCIITSNFAEKATILENTMVINVSVDSEGMFGNGITFPAELNAQMTETEFLAFLTKQNITNYDLYKETGHYTIPFDQSGNDRSQSGNKYEVRVVDGKVDSIDMTCYGWLRN